jgi:hypothetical protein
METFSFTPCKQASSSSDMVSGVEARRALHCSRLNVTYGDAMGTYILSIMKVLSFYHHTASLHQQATLGNKLLAPASWEYTSNPKKTSRHRLTTSISLSPLFILFLFAHKGL